MRAVHLEVAASMDTGSYIDAIRRFVARRGVLKIMMSDNGTNIVGAKGEFDIAFVFDIYRFSIYIVPFKACCISSNLLPNGNVLMIVLY